MLKHPERKKKRKYKLTFVPPTSYKPPPNKSPFDGVSRFYFAPFFKILLNDLLRKIYCEIKKFGKLPNNL